MKKSLIFTLILLAALFASKPIFASHFAGGELTYTCIGGNTYQINLVIYRDCSGVNATPTATVTFNCSSNPMFNFTTNLALVLGTGQEITQGCSNYPTKCSGGNNYGIQEYVYQGYVTLVPCDSWKMSYSDCCRNPVTNAPNNNTNSFYMEATLDNLNAPCNNSPTFSNEAISLVCLNTAHCINPETIELDNDSLVYSLQAPLTTGPNSQVIYSPPYAPANFIISNPPMTLDPTTGDICFTSTSNVISLTRLSIQEWRKINGVQKLIGTVNRDLQIRVDYCLFQQPTLSGMDFQNTHKYSATDTTFYAEMCLGESISFDINGHDSDLYDPYVMGNPEHFHIDWDEGIPSASLISYCNHTDTAYAHFFWVPTAIDVSNKPKCFTAIIHDYACPYYNSRKFIYCIKVKPPINPPFIGNDTNICVNHNLPLDAGQADSYLWFNGDTTQTTLVDASTLGVGNHQIVVTITKNGCTASDTLNLTIDPCLGFEKLEESFDFQINPNPSTGQFYLTFNKNIVSPVKLEIYSPLGQTVLRKEIPISNQNTISFELNNVSKGVYYIKLISEESTLTKTIIIR